MPVIPTCLAHYCLVRIFSKWLYFFWSFYIFASAILQENMLMNYSATRMSVSERKKEIPFLLFYKLWCISHVLSQPFWFAFRADWWSFTQTGMIYWQLLLCPLQSGQCWETPQLLIWKLHAYFLFIPAYDNVIHS